MISDEANDALSSLVLDGIFDEASGSIKYILSQVVLKIKDQEKHILRIEQNAKEMASKHEKAMKEASEKHGKEILSIMKGITDATNAKIYEMEKTLATLVYNIQGFEMKVNEQSEAQKRAEKEYQARINNQLSKLDADRKKEAEAIRRREEEFQREEKARLRKLQESEDALRADLDKLQREQKRSLSPTASTNTGSGPSKQMLEQLEAQMKHDLEMEKMKLEREKMLAEQKMEEDKLNWEKEQSEKMMKDAEDARKKFEEAEIQRMAALEEKIADMTNAKNVETKDESKEALDSDKTLTQQREQNLLDRWNTLQKLLVPEDIEKYKKSFHLFDTDNSGTVSADEVDAMLKSMGINVPISEIDRLISEVDIDGTGEIDEREFIIMMVTAESSPEWKQIKNRVSDLTREKVDPSKSIGNRLKELESFYHSAEAKFRKAELTQQRLDSLEKKLDQVIQEQLAPFGARIDTLDQELSVFSDRFENVEKNCKLIDGKIKNKESKERADQTIKRVQILEEIIPTKLSKEDLGDIRISLLNDLKEAVKDNVTKAELEDRLKLKADVTRLGLKADQDIVDAVIERIEEKVEHISGDVENIKVAEEAEARHREEQRKREEDIVNLVKRLNNRVELTAGNVEEDVQRLQSALVGKADRSKVVEILSRLGEMGNSNEALKRIKRKLGDKASKIDLDRVFKLASKLKKNVTSLDNSMKGLSDVDGAAVKCLACDRPLANLSESTLLDDGPAFYEEPNPPLGKPSPKAPYVIHPLHRAGALRPLGLQYRIQRPRTVDSMVRNRRNWGGSVHSAKPKSRPYSGTPQMSYHGGNKYFHGTSTHTRVNSGHGFYKANNVQKSRLNGNIESFEPLQAALSPESHFGSSSRSNMTNANEVSSSTLTNSSDYLTSSGTSFQQMRPLKQFIQGCDGKYYQAGSR